MLMVVRVLSRKTGLGLEKQTGSLQLGRERVSADSIGPDTEMLGPPRWPNTSFEFFRPVSPQINYEPKERDAGENIDISLSGASLAVHTPHQSFEPSPPPPPTKPPPHPPDPSFKLWTFEHLSRAVAVHDTVGSIPLGINGRMDAASDDPGDGRFHQFSTSWDCNFDFTHSLEGKADFKGSVRAVITTRGNYVEDCRSVLPPPAEPPPSSLNCLANPDCERKLIEREHLHLGPPLAGYFILPIWPCLLLGFQLDLFPYQDSSELNKRFKLKPPPEPPPQLPSYLDYGKLEYILSEEGNHAGNETQNFFNDFPRLPEIGDEGEQRTSKWAPTRMKDGRESVDLSCATHSLLKAISSKTEQKVDIGYAMRVNAELELHLILMLGRANLTLNRVCEASCYGAFGCIFHPGSKSHLINQGRSHN